MFVNHETSLVPFPANLTDFTNAMVSRLASTLPASRPRRALRGPVRGELPAVLLQLPRRRRQGFEQEILFTNEEATDLVNRTGAWPAGDNAEQAGVVVALDLRTNRYRAIYGMGRTTTRTRSPSRLRPSGRAEGDDTFTAPSSQLYLYTSPSASAASPIAASCGRSSPTTRTSTTTAICPGRRASRPLHPVPRDVAVGPGGARTVVGAERRVRVHPGRGHRVRPHDPERRLLRRHRRAAGAPGEGPARMTRGPSGTRGRSRTGGSSGSRSIRLTRRR